MTVAEESFYTDAPRKLNAIEDHLEKIANCIEVLIELVTKIYCKEE